MNKVTEQAPKSHEIGSSALVFFITFAGILVTLFSGDGVSDFSDVSQVQYAVAFLTAMGTAMKDIQSQRKELIDA